MELSICLLMEWNTGFKTQRQWMPATLIGKMCRCHLMMTKKSLANLQLMQRSDGEMLMINSNYLNTLKNSYLLSA